MLVELTLIQVAQLTTEGDDGSGGRGPKKTIKPVFTQPAAAQQPQAASATTVQQNPVHSSPSSTSTQGCWLRYCCPSAADACGDAVRIRIAFFTECGGFVSSVTRAGSFPNGKGRTAESSGDEDVQSGRVYQESAAWAGDSEYGCNCRSKVQMQPEEDLIFNDRDLNYYWQEYAAQLPKEQDALMKRMQMLRPALFKNSTTFEVVVDNEMAAKDFTALIPELQEYLRVRLRNSQVAMKVRVSEAAETIRPVGRVEKFQMMAQKNQALMQLKEEFGLELY